MALAAEEAMRVLMLGPFEKWVRNEARDLEVLQVADAKEAMEALSRFQPALMIVNQSIAGEPRETLIRHAESLGCSVIAGTAAVQIPGATMQELEKHAILETLKSVGGSTTKAAKVLGISTRKIQYRLKDWNIRPAVLVQQPAVADPRH